MGLYLPPLVSDARCVDAMVADARQIIRSARQDDADLAELDIGIGLDVGPAYVGIVGEGEVRDFTAIGDVVNVAARLQSAAAPGQIVMSTQIAQLAGVSDGKESELSLKGVDEPVHVRIVDVLPNAAGQN